MGFGPKRGASKSFLKALEKGRSTDRRTKKASSTITVTMYVPPKREGWKNEEGCLVFYGKRGLKLTVHTYVGSGDALHVTCYELRIEKHDLHTTDIKQAKERAISHALKVAREYIDDLDDAFKALK